MVRLRSQGGGVPLALHVARYFVLAFVLIVVMWVACFASLSALMEVGMVYPANWGAANAREVASQIQEEVPFDPESVPTAYRYALFDADGRLVSTDMDEDALARSREIASEGALTEETEVTGNSGTTYVYFGLDDGTSCALSSVYMPQFTSPALRDSLPNPQNIMLAAGLAGSLASVAFAAARAGRFIRRKLAPLTDAAGRVARQDLEFSVEAGGVREVDAVLSAMDGMRSSLKESLEARWDVERRQREKIAALAHDLKTPLTVIRANSEYVAEEAADLAADVRMANRERLAALADAASSAAAGTERLDSYVHLLISASRGLLPSDGDGRTLAENLFAIIERDGRSLARSEGVSIELQFDEKISPLQLAGDVGSLSRAAMNIISNAVEHSASCVIVKTRLSEDGFLVIEVDDDGSGFSAEALERGCELFFSDDPSRSHGHYGLGLFIASEIMRACGGMLSISNLGSVEEIKGARVSMSIPVIAEE